MFEAGFLGTRAPLYMDMVTIFFGLLPFLVGFSILLVIKKKYRAHFQSQGLLFILTMVMVVVFETGVRLDGGFNHYMQGSSLSYTAVFTFLIVHIIIALITVVVWGATIYNAMRIYVKEGPRASYFIKHQKHGRWLFIGITLTATMGVSLYPMLFIF